MTYTRKTIFGKVLIELALLFANNEIGGINVDKLMRVTFTLNKIRRSLYFILYSENQCISKLDKIGIFIDMKFH